jgi:uncharacterized protein
MAKAGFWAIHTGELKFGSDGRWYADGEPVLHDRLARLFSRYVRRKTGGGYEIWISEQYHTDVTVEDTAYVVTAVDADAAGALVVELSDGTTESLALDSLSVGPNNVLYCRVKNGTEPARFLRPAYYQLAPYLEEVSPGTFQLRCADAAYPITQL